MSIQRVPNQSLSHQKHIAARFKRAVLAKAPLRNAVKLSKILLVAIPLLAMTLGGTTALAADKKVKIGVTMALFDDATNYAALTTALAAALDDSFARDPVFGIAAPHFMFVRGPRRRLGKVYSRTPTPPSLPMLVRGSGDTAR